MAIWCWKKDLRIVVIIGEILVRKWKVLFLVIGGVWQVYG